jgi:hypothetical protein
MVLHLDSHAVVAHPQRCRGRSGHPDARPILETHADIHGVKYVAARIAGIDERSGEARLWSFIGKKNSH